MALQIGESCLACYACETVCPKGAITIADNTFIIDKEICNECNDIEIPRCLAICPEPGVITYHRSDNKKRCLGTF